MVYSFDILKSYQKERLCRYGMGIAFIPNECVENRPGIRFIPLRNWHQALYMCILYDKWLDQPVWDFVEIVVKAFRKKN